MAFDSIRDLRLFVRIYEQASITAAADALRISTAVASKRLQNLEAQAGEALFHRSTRHLAPTGAGVVLYDFARAIIATVDEAETRLEGGKEPSGLLKVTTSVAFGRLYLADIVAAFLARYRKVQIDMTFTDRILDMVDDGIDVAIRITAPVDIPNVVMRRLCSGRRILCASPNYVTMHGMPSTPDDLRLHNCVVLNHYDAWTLESGARQYPVKVHGNYHTNDGEDAFEAIRSGLGIGVVALWHGAPFIATGSLLRVLPGHELSGQPNVYAVYHPSQRFVLRLRRFLEFVEERLELPFKDPDEFLARYSGPADGPEA